MNTFYRHIQPTIVKLSDDPEIPEKLRNNYLINYNVWGIDYFDTNYLLAESNDGAYLILKEDSWNFILEDSLSEGDILDLPRLYIVISEDFIQNVDDSFHKFIFNAFKENSIYANGEKGFMPGVDYYLNYTLYNYLANTNQIKQVNFDNRLPNYLDGDGCITKYWIDLSDSPVKDYTNLEYFNKKNSITNNKFTEDELNVFYKNFSQIILNETAIGNHPEIMSKPKNQLYNTVLNYFANNQNDDTLYNLKLVLGTNFGNKTDYSVGCNCSKNKSQDMLTKPCYSLYTDAMDLYVKQMLGDIEFYEDWFNIYMTEDDEYIGNDVLIENLLEFIKEFIGLEYTLDFSNKTTKVGSCQKLSICDNDYNYKIIENYNKVLHWVLNNEMTENTNKIKIYGEQFGELLPKLQF